MNRPADIRPQDRDSGELEKAVHEGIASLDAGKRILYDKIRRWLLSWGTKDELPPPE
jgi:predicted transcriptional regulator